MYLYTTSDVGRGESMQMLEKEVTRLPVKRTVRKLNKHEARTEATQEKLILAAEAIFTRDGFANAKLEEIAEHAGYTRGAIYAHYKSKEDLFLVLFEQRANAKTAEFRKLLEEPRPLDERMQKFRTMFLKLACDRSWSLLILEFKLFALRQPKLKARLRRIQATLHATSRDEFVRLLFGEVKADAAHDIKRRMSLLGSIASAVVLESHFRPEVLGGGELEAVLGELFEAVVRR
jgi:AcrR family transcriptional regulator